MNYNLPIAPVVLSLYLGATMSWFSKTEVIPLIGLLAIAVIILTVLTAVKSIHKNIPWIRIAGVSLISFLIGSIHFGLNDERMSEIRQLELNSEETFSVRVLEAGKASVGTQNLVVESISRFSNGEIQPIEAKFLIRIQEADKEYEVDDHFVVHGALSPIKNNGNPGEFDAESYYEKKGIFHRMFALGVQVEQFDHQATLNGMFTRWRNYLAELMETQLNGEFLAISKALILGDKSDLDKETMSAFTNTGSMHVLAVSGLHVGLLLTILNAFLSQFAAIISKRKALIFSIALIWVYGFLTGASPSVMRAVFMFTMIAVGTLLQRKSSGMYSLLVTSVLLFFMDPWVMFDIGFQLSFAAMLGIFLIYPMIQHFIEPKNKWIKWMWEGTAVGVAATIFTTPLTLFWFHQFPNYFLLANIGVMVFGFFVLLLGLIFLLTAAIPFLSSVVALIFSFSIVGLLVWVYWVESIPGAVSSGFQLSLFIVFLSYTIIFAWVVKSSWKYWKPALVVATVLLFGIISYQRVEVLNQQQFVVLNANQLIVVVKSKKQAIAFYEPRYGHADIVPDQLLAYEKFMGSKLKIYSLHSDLKMHFVGDNYLFTKAKNGWNLQRNKIDYFFQTRGIPDPKTKHTILSSSLKSYLNPDAKQSCFSYSW